MAQSRRVSSYTMEYKLSMLKWYHENGEDKHAASREFGIDRKRVREWLDKEDSLLSNQVGSAKKKRKLNAGKDPLSVELDHAVLEYLLEERAAGRPVSNRDISAKAIELAQELDDPPRFVQGFDDVDQAVEEEEPSQSPLWNERLAESTGGLRVPSPKLSRSSHSWPTIVSAFTTLMA